MEMDAAWIVIDDNYTDSIPCVQEWPLISGVIIFGVYPLPLN